MERFSLHDANIRFDSVEFIVPARHQHKSFWCIGKGIYYPFDSKTGQYPLTLWRVIGEKTVCVDGFPKSMLDGDITDVSVTLSQELVWVLTDKSSLFLMDAKWLV